MSSEDIPAALNAYMVMWNERDVTKVADHVARVFTDQAAFTDPLHEVVGHAAITEMVVGTRNLVPESQYRLTSAVDQHHGRCRYHWYADLGDGNGMPGFDVAVIGDDGRISRVDGFFGELSLD